jgi:hypothetical protein
MGIKDIVLGDSERYDYSTMCKPNIPCMNMERSKLNFYTKGEQQCGKIRKMLFCSKFLISSSR